MEYRNGQKELRFTAYLYDPKTETDISRLAQRDIWLKQDIARCKEIIKELEAYRFCKKSCGTQYHGLPYKSYAQERKTMER